MECLTLYFTLHGETLKILAADKEDNISVEQKV